jgi:hypothetical protein
MEPETLRHYNIFIFAGQSNMAGTDALIDPEGPGTADLVVTKTQLPADRAALFANNTQKPGMLFGDIRGHNVASFGAPINPGNGLPYMGHGPEVGFNRTLYAAGIRDIAIISFAANYSALENGRSAWVAPNSLWTALIEHIDKHLAELTTCGHTYDIGGVVWQQGIDDALLGRTHNAYLTDIRHIRDDLRSTYGTDSTPFIIAKEPTSRFPDAALMADIQRAEVDIGCDSHCRWIDYSDLTPYINVHHISADNHLIGGQRFANAWLSAAK